jgi:hypothetical protein
MTWYLFSSYYLEGNIGTIIPHFHLDIFTTQLTPWTEVLFENQRVFELVRKFLPFYGTQRFITVLPTAFHWTLP